MKDSRCIPAPGWYAVFKDDGGYFTLPLVCFEVNYNFESLNPYTAVGLVLVFPKRNTGSTLSTEMFRELDCADEIEGFIGYLPPGKDLQEWLKED